MFKITNIHQLSLLILNNKQNFYIKTINLYGFTPLKRNQIYVDNYFIAIFT